MPDHHRRPPALADSQWTTCASSRVPLQVLAVPINRDVEALEDVLFVRRRACELPISLLPHSSLFTSRTVNVPSHANSLGLGRHAWRNSPQSRVPKLELRRNGISPETLHTLTTERHYTTPQQPWRLQRRTQRSAKRREGHASVRRRSPGSSVFAE